MLSISGCKDNDNSKSKNNISKLEYQNLIPDTVWVSDTNQPEIVEIPNTIKKIKAGEPKISYDRPEEILLGEPIVKELNPTLRVLGSGDVKKALVFDVEDSSQILSLPKTTSAKEYYSKDINVGTFRSLSKQQGLSHNQVIEVTKDSRGNILIATLGGLNIFDGSDFKMYGMEHGIPSNYIYCALEDRNGDYWVGTYGKGICRLTGDSIHYYNTSNGFISDYVLKLMEDTEGNIWFGTGGDGVVKYDGNQFEHFSNDQGLKDGYILSLFEDSKNSIWIGTEEGAYKLSNDSMIVMDVNTGLSGNEIYSFQEDLDGKIWMATAGGGLCYLKDEKSYGFNSSNGLPSGQVNSVLFDKVTNQFWISFYNSGFGKLKGNNLTFFDEKDGLSNVSIYDLESGQGNDVLIATGLGLTCFSGETYIHDYKDVGIPNNSVYAMLNDGNQVIGATCGGGLFFQKGNEIKTFTKEQGLLNDRLYCLEKDSNNDLWIGSDQGLTRFDGEHFYQFTNNDSLRAHRIYSIDATADSVIWLGTDATGLIGITDSSYINITTKQGLPNDVVSALDFDEKGRLWIGTYGGGVSVYDGNKFLTYNSPVGLAGDVVYDIHISDNVVWLATDGGLVQYIEGKGFLTLTTENGLSNNFILSVAAHSNTEILVGTRNGFNVLDTESLKKRINDIEGINNSRLFTKYLVEDGFLGSGCNRSTLLSKNDSIVWGWYE